MQQTNQRPASASGTFLLADTLKIYRLGFGAMRITGRGVWGPPPDKQASLAVLRHALELGINFIDTANSYGPEVSETLIAEALYPYPEHLVIATKGGYGRSGPDQWYPDGHPDHLRAALEGSLKRLRVDRIDVYQLHTPDPKIPFEDSVGELVKQQAAGKIRSIGLSNVNSQQLEQARKMTTIVSVQNRYNLTDRASEDVLDICQSESIGFIPWFPLATGDLAKDQGQLARIASQHHATPGQIALAWLLKRACVMLPIPGTNSLKHLEENARAAEIQLSDEEYQTISEGFPKK
ncbi:aldo/keto reductase [Dictyobacter arantiisoli]|uniref:Oxidoreductase n=1 Tax=Dictyobacter arantiisoli TaxID=2014874 RepID=A0A5A5TBS6_9CHLR|nr:aldo/keto reductase [Dictyobacter arantiisoli]GCF08950.1 oxidoreductase [Dictyobacter arantiisoli]